jgi:hypothetical protein
MKTPPFDDAPEAFNQDLDGHLLPIEDPDFGPFPVIETEAPEGFHPSPWRGCQAVVILGGAVIGTALGTGFAAAGALLAGWIFDVPVPWPF